MKKSIVGALLLSASHVAWADSPETPAITPEQIKRGSALYAQHCAPCHGPQIKDPEGSFDLRNPVGRSRAIRAIRVERKECDASLESLLKPEDINALWAYVVAGALTRSFCY